MSNSDCVQSTAISLNKAINPQLLKKNSSRRKPWAQLRKKFCCKCLEQRRLSSDITPRTDAVGGSSTKRSLSRHQGWFYTTQLVCRVICITGPLCGGAITDFYYDRY
ncbi:uncharacterized protein SPPG_09358 [Spizellomyces punctatus DAOM BR117]|uniref:Uncharacterized protein n=1 Tax=Spizellomyces punctatus (strain DAOM BR117) TaxID=645134 RepID=A0A0L0HCR9_SPIPD|nr:uncharacterized protein SPPG_09358 [Spizellomyces punctatus DAOM BR117]KNC98533.1 hypothetical protein SPPG_09358 [Spizellomyces punctatus DAOM BR117]|eukprot:XP_016606573.1 hypothetical protein SPPG_09358 [Spizellomyces punctatus DAOM BR117]